jgi:hypothetical protein
LFEKTLFINKIPKQRDSTTTELREYDGVAWAGGICFRIRTSGRIL